MLHTLDNKAKYKDSREDKQQQRALLLEEVYHIYIYILISPKLSDRQNQTIGAYTLLGASFHQSGAYIIKCLYTYSTIATAIHTQEISFFLSLA